MAVLNFWEERYASEEYSYGVNPNEFFARTIQDIKEPGKLLLPAEGEGRNAVFAAKLGWKVEAFDFSINAKRKALKLASESAVQINYELRALEDIQDLREPFDLIGLCYVHILPSLRSKFHRYLSKILKPGGFIIMEAFSTEQLGLSSGGPKRGDMLYSTEMLEMDFKELEITKLEAISIELKEGKYHQGEAQVVRMIAHMPVN